MAVLPVAFEEGWRREQHCAICDIPFMPDTLVQVSEDAYAPICPACQAYQSREQATQRASDWVRMRLDRDRKQKERLAALRDRWRAQPEWER